MLGLVLSALLAGANAYLGLFAGLTVAASIPAAVISMAVLRLWRNSNILENNMVQTIASAGESLAAGVIFTIPGARAARLLAGVRLLVGQRHRGARRLARRAVHDPAAPHFDSRAAARRIPEGKATAEVLKVGVTRRVAAR